MLIEGYCTDWVRFWFSKSRKQPVLSPTVVYFMQLYQFPMLCNVLLIELLWQAPILHLGESKESVILSFYIWPGFRLKLNHAKFGKTTNYQIFKLHSQSKNFSNHFFNDSTCPIPPQLNTSQHSSATRAKHRLHECHL